jgi:nitrile hydratase
VPVRVEVFRSTSGVAVDGIHDLGGMDGFGRVERDEYVFRAAWERKAFAMAMTVHVDGNTDDFRHSIERIDPAQYLTAGYYGRWLASTEIRLRERHLIDSDEVDARCGSAAARPRSSPSIALPGPGSPGGPVKPVDRAPRFHVGQRVRARNLHPAGHTRLPRYVRGHCGVIATVHPAFVFPDSNAHGRGEDPQHLYGVRFHASDLWGVGDHLVSVDLFEPYLDTP